MDEHVYVLKEIPKNAKVSPELDAVPKKKKSKSKAHKPPMSHPWKRQSFILQQQRAHKYHQYT